MITGVVLARNEANTIASCLKSLAPFVRELILIDMESTDDTVELARPLVNRVLTHPVVANFDAARNIAIGEASHDWLWFLDADERVPPSTGQLVNELVRERGHEFVALTIPFRTYFCGRWIQNCGWWPGYTMPRVLKRGFFRFSEQLHQGVQYHGPELRLPANPETAIEHFSYASIEHYVEKFNRYTTTEASYLNQPDYTLDWRAGIDHLMRDLWQYYELHRGDRDGFHGWVLSWLAGQYRWFSHAKVMDLVPERLESALVPPNLDSVLQQMENQLSSLRAPRPELPLGISWRSPLWDPSGYADDSRVIVKSLACHDRELSIEAINWSHLRCELSPEESALFRALERVRQPKSKAAITHCIPTITPEPDPTASLNIIRTTFETDRIPTNWLPILDRYDEVWGVTERDRLTFRRAGVAPEKLRVLNEFVDTDRFTPRGRKYRLPEELKNRFVFLSIFDWQFRKGWDVLLPAYCKTFAADAGVGLLLKISAAHGHSSDAIREQAREACPQLDDRTDIVFLEDLLSADELAGLYRSVDAFILPSRGEGWGRPYMEAMASGLPVIGTRGCGSDEFMTDENSFLVDSSWVEVPARAAQEIPVYHGHRWREPARSELQQQMLLVSEDEDLCKAKAKRARTDMQKQFSLPQAAHALEVNLSAAEERFRPQDLPAVSESHLRVQLEGELFASHSFANVNEALLRGFVASPAVAMSVNRKLYNPVIDSPFSAQRQLLPYCARELPGGPQVVIRHAFPPDWSPPPDGAKWVHIQPWEFGHLPLDWLEPLRREVDEVWAPSNYVKRVYEASGVAGEKVTVIPWGVDPDVYNPQAPPHILSTDKLFVFLFMGGTIARKGFDLLLEAYTSEFTSDDDVCLVIKDVGTTTFYRYGNYREQVLRHLESGNSPEIVYIEQDYTDGQRASLLTACDCLVAPYRGEGFGLPILEAMACGLPAIVPRGGASDDFVTDDTGYLVNANEVECDHDWRLCGPACELLVDVDELRQQLRAVSNDHAGVAARGEAASRHILTNYTWKQTTDTMVERISALASEPKCSKARQVRPPTLTACILSSCNEQSMGDCLGRLRPYVQEIVVVDLGSPDTTADIAGEYGARVYHRESEDGLGAARNFGLSKATSDWILALDADEYLDERHLRSIHEFMHTASADVVCATTLICPQGAQNGQHDRQPRVFRNRKEIVYTGRGYEDVFTTARNVGQIVDTDIQIMRAVQRSEQVVRYRDPATVYRLLRQDLAQTQDGLTRANLGRLHYEQGNYFHAECYLNDSFTSGVSDVATLLIDCHDRKGDPDRAHEIRRQAQHNGHRADHPHVPLRVCNGHATRLYLGAGTKCLPGYTHVDVAAGEHIDVVHDLNHRPWPWDDDSVQMIVAEDLVEHLEIDVVTFCNEAWRVLQPDGELFIRTPHHAGDSSWIDPTHRWHLNEQAFHYLDPDTQWGQLYPQYTPFKWQLLSIGVRGPQNIHVLMTPRKSEKQTAIPAVLGEEQ